MADAIEARGVSKRFGEGTHAVTALDRVDVVIRQNEFFTLLGPSGCGKTTLLRLIAGFELPSEGSILLDGEEIGDLPPFRRPVNTVFQSYALFPHLTVAQNVAFGPEMQGRPRAWIDARVQAMLRLVQLEGLAARMPRQLSGGQQQRVALARALASEPKVLLLDEPLSALDLKLRKEMQLELKRLQHETGITFVFVTHDQEEALTMSDRIAVMDKGRILQLGTPTEIYDRPATRFVADFIGETNLIEGRLTSVEGDRASFAVPGGTIEVTPPPPLAAGTAATLAVRPERIELVTGSPPLPGLAGTIERLVYVGAETLVHVRTDAGLAVRVRLQNHHGAIASLTAGLPVGLRIPAEAARVLEA
jgi:spermidine/putrescine transport system ATP-binding protein